MKQDNIIKKLKGDLTKYNNLKPIGNGRFEVQGEMNIMGKTLQTEELNEYLECCLCGNTIMYVHDSHNPYPLSDNPDDRCCKPCNDGRVMASRIGGILKKS
jgi:hypothetical protein